MIDFHNHVIPNIDDGPKKIEVSLDMMKKAHEDGITCVVNTVHLQHPKMHDKNTDYEFIINETNKFQKVLKKNNIPVQIKSQAEVYFKDNIKELIENPLANISGKYMLIEFENFFMPENFKDILFILNCNGIYPIIAHPERYRCIQNNISLIDDWFKRDYIIQLTCGSILGEHGKKNYKTAHQILKKGKCHLIGSDAHNNKKRNFLMREALELIGEKYGKKNKDIIAQNSFNVFEGKMVNKMVEIKTKNFSIKKKFNILLKKKF